MTDNNTLLMQTKSYLNNVFNILRADVNASEYHFVLFLLTLQKEGILDGLFNREEHNLLQAIPYNIVESRSKNSQKYEKIWEVFQPVLAKLNRITLIEIVHLFRELDHNILQENFSEIFDDLLYKLTKSQGKFGGEYIQPLELSQFLSNLVELPKGAKIYNPFAGLASFGVFTEESNQYLGQELNYTTWALGQLRLIAYNRELNSEFLQGDSIENWNPKKEPFTIKSEGYFKILPKNEQYDLIIANPPFNLHPVYPLEGKFGIFKNCEHFLIEKGLEDLKTNGKIIAVVSLGFLFRGASEQGLRQYLVEYDYLEMVIVLPEGLLVNTSIPFAILVINKEKKNKDFVKFVNARDYVVGLKRKEKKLECDRLLEIIKSDSPSKDIQLVDNNTIRETDYNLTPNRYLSLIDIRLDTGEYLVELSELLSLESGSIINNESYGRIVRTKDLKTDSNNYLLDSLEPEELSSTKNYKKIDSSCLLVTTRWNTLKPTYFKQDEVSNNSIYITPDISAFKVNTNKVNLDFLVYELNSDYVINQLNIYRSGGVNPSVSRSDLLKIKIKLPQLTKQQIAKMKGVKEAYIASKKIQLQLEQELLGLENNISREFDSMKHTLRQFLSALKSNVLGTKKFISNNEGQPISLNTIYSKNLNQTFEEHLLSLEGTIDSMSKVLLSLDENNESVDPVGKYEVQKLIKEAQARYGNPTIFEFLETFFDSASFDSVEPEINIAENDFYTLFSNIISNAINHGFKNSTKHNLVRVCLSYNASTNSCEIEISNNGKPIPEQFTLQHLTTRGEKTTDSNGRGIGGADIKVIVEKYNGYFDLVTDEDSDFPVTYIIGFPQLRQIEDAM